MLLESGEATMHQVQYIYIYIYIYIYTYIQSTVALQPTRQQAKDKRQKARQKTKREREGRKRAEDDELVLNCGDCYCQDTVEEEIA